MTEDSQPFLAVLADAFRARRTGVVRVTRGEGRLAVGLQDGRIVAYESEAMPASTHDEDRELAALLADAFAEGSPTLSQAAARQKVVETLRAGDARARFEEGGVEPPDPPLAFATEDLLREAAHTAELPLVDAILGPLDRPLAVGDSVEIALTLLTPSEGFLLSRIDGTSTADEVLNIVPMDSATARRSLCGLRLVGLVREAGGPTVPEPRPKEPPPALPATVVPKDAATEARARVLGERRELLLSTHARVVAQFSHFAVLDVPLTARPEEVKAAYFRMAKQFHPDALGDLPDLRDVAEAVFTRLGQAYAALSQPESRARHEALLGQPRLFGAPRPPGVTFSQTVGDSAASRPPPPSVSGPPLSPPAAHPADDLARQAEEALERAEGQLAEGQYWDVIQSLEPRLASLEGRALQKGRIVLAQAYRQNPKWVHRAEALLREVVGQDPAHAEAYYLLGTIYRAGGLGTRAASMYRKALEAHPGHKQAAEELLSLEKAPPPPRRWFGGRKSAEE
jgi:hypothetical protein